MDITIFLADDHAVMRDGLRLLLQMEKNFNVIGEANNGREAVSQIIKLSPDVVIMDIGMPKIDGIEAARQIHKTDPAIKIIILSMHDTTDHVYRALKAGALGYVLKEETSNEVIQAVKTVYQDERYLSRKISEKLISSYLNHLDTLENPVDSLSERELEILRFLIHGKTNAEIGVILDISAKTVQTYRTRLTEKIGVKDIPGLIRFAIKHNLISMDELLTSPSSQRHRSPQNIHVRLG